MKRSIEALVVVEMIAVIAAMAVVGLCGHGLGGRVVSATRAREEPGASGVPSTRP